MLHDVAHAVPGMAISGFICNMAVKHMAVAVQAVARLPTVLQHVGLTEIGLVLWVSRGPRRSAGNAFLFSVDDMWT
jgi:hypothetical protein